MRPLGYCRHLRSYGWEPCVLTTNPENTYPLHKRDANLERRIPYGVPVIRVPYVDRLSQLLQLRDRVCGLWKGISSKSAVTVQPKSGEGEGAGDSKGRPSLKQALLEAIFEFPDRQCSWAAEAVQAGRSFGQPDIPDAVFATGGPWTSFVVGHELATHFRCPLLLDYRDPWTCNPYYSYSSPFLRWRAHRLEERLFRLASRVVANTEELKQEFAVQFPALAQKVVCIPNGYDREIVGAGESVAQNFASSEESGYEFCHFGTVYGRRTPKALFKAVLTLFQNHAIAPKQIKMRFVGGWDVADVECNRFAEELEAHGFLKREPAVAHDACMREMSRSNTLLVLQPDSPMQIPAKIYEYVATGRPLLLVGGEGATANLVRRHSLGLDTPNDAVAIRALLEDLAGGQRRLMPPSAKEIARFDYHQLAGELSSVLDAAVGAGQAL
ncbi:MAG: glycosyltransferase [Nitrospiraceae bacterium]